MSDHKQSQQACTPPGPSGKGNLPVSVKGAHFTLPPQDVYSVYPPVNGEGHYGNSIAHIILKKRKSHWENSFGKLSSTDGGDTLPCLALLCVPEKERGVLAEHTIGELLQTTAKNPRVFYPLTVLPECAEKEENLCCTLDLTVQQFRDLMPQQEELEFLVHEKIMNVDPKTGKPGSSDDCFLVITGSPILPSGTSQVQKCTPHLVSLEGFGDMLPRGEREKNLDWYEKVRLVSLYRWDVCSAP